jgi:hypothetical protein
MKRLPHYHFLRVLSTVILLASAAYPGWAQQDNAPKPPARTYPPVVSGGDQTPESQLPALEPDQSSLTGAQEFTLGSPEMRHTYWVPGFQFENLFQSNAQGNGGSGSWISNSYILGTLSLFTQSRHSETDLNYSGGGSVTNSSTIPNTYYHQLEFGQKFSWNRWRFLVLDNFSYLPASSFGFGGAGTLATPGVGGGLEANFPGLQANYVPSQSIFTPIGPRYTNATVAQAEYALTSRSSFTAVGSFGILRLTQSSGIESNNAIFSLGYNYQFTPLDTLGLLYRFSGFRYPGNPQALNDHSANLAYGRKITGRLALQLFAGPEVTTFRLPVASQASRTSASAGALLAYAWVRTNVSISYSHGLTAGSGVQLGSNRDLVQAQVSRRLSRLWVAKSEMGYARNAAIAGGTPAVGSQDLNSFNVSAGLDRQLSRSASFSVSYAFDYQNLNQALCTAGTCGPNYRAHQIWVGFRWRASPVVIR